MHGKPIPRSRYLYIHYTTVRVYAYLQVNRRGYLFRYRDWSANSELISLGRIVFAPNIDVNHNARTYPCKCYITQNTIKY